MNTDELLVAWWDSDARARDLCWHSATDDERLALWWRLREYPSERWDLRGRMNAGQRTAIWLSFLHPDDRRQVKDETSDRVLAVRDWLLMDLLDYFSIDWAMQIPLLPHRLAYLYDKSGLLPERDAVQVIARTKTFMFSLLLECDEASWQAYRSCIEGAASLLEAENRLARRFRRKAPQLEKTGFRMDSVRDECEQLVRRHSPWHESVTLRFNPRRQPLGWNDGASVWVAQHMEVFESAAKNRNFGLAVLVRELLHLDLQRRATPEPDVEDRLNAWLERKHREMALPTLVIADVTPVRPERLFGVVECPGLLQLLLGLVEDITVTARLSEQTPDFALLWSEYVGTCISVMHGWELLDRRGRLLQAVCQEALGPTLPEPPPDLMLPQWAEVREQIRTLRATPDRTGPQLMLLATELYDALSPTLAQWFEPRQRLVSCPGWTSLDALIQTPFG